MQENQRLQQVEVTARNQEGNVAEYKNRLKMLADEVERLNAYLLQRGEDLGTTHHS